MASDDAEVIVLGVDASDPRAAAELSRWIPTDATAIYWTPGLRGQQYPLGSLLAWARGSHGRPTAGDRDAIASTIESIASDRDVPERELSTATPPGSTQRSSWWTTGAWTVTVFPFVIAIAAVALVATEDSLLRWAFAAMITIASLALLVGFHYAHAAAAIHHADPEIAAAAANEIGDRGDGRDSTDEHRTGRGLPVLVVPERNAAGVAAELRDLDVRADSRIVGPDGDPNDASATDPRSRS